MSEASRGGGLGEAIAHEQGLYLEWWAKQSRENARARRGKGRGRLPFPFPVHRSAHLARRFFFTVPPRFSLFSRITKPGPKLLEEQQINPKEDVLLRDVVCKFFKYGPNLAAKHFEMSELGGLDVKSYRQLIPRTEYFSQPSSRQQRENLL